MAELLWKGGMCEGPWGSRVCRLLALQGPVGLFCKDFVWLWVKCFRGQSAVYNPESPRNFGKHVCGLNSGLVMYSG